MNQVLLIILVMLGIIVLSKFKRPFYQSIFVSTLVLALFLNLSSLDFLNVVLLTFSSPKNLQLIAAVIIITVMIKLLQENGVLEKMVDSLSSIFGNPKMALMIVPAMVGIIPFPGGAGISAPLVDNIGKELQLTSKRLSVINLYFRHAWLFVAPHRPGIILAVGLAGVELGSLIIVQSPLVLFSFITAYWLLLRKAEFNQIVKTAVSNRGHSLQKFLLYSSPLMVPLIMYLVFPKVLLPIPLFVGLIISIILTRNNFLWVHLYQYIDWKFTVTIYSILLFSSMVSLLSELSEFIQILISFGLNLEIIVFVLPFLFGFSTGNFLGSIAVTFPLLVGLLPQGDKLIYYIMVMYVGSFVGYFSSPMHLCQVLSNEYFKVSLADAYKEYGPLIVMLIAFTYVLFMIYYYF